MPREITKAQQQAVSRYESANYDKVLVRMPKGQREKIKQAAEAAGASLNGFIMIAIESALQGEGIAIDRPGSVNLDAETLARAQAAAEAAGEDLQAWIARAIDDTASRDELLRAMKR